MNAVQEIEYRENGQTVTYCRGVDKVPTVEAASVVAQKYMAQMKTIDSAHIFTATTETVIRKTTEWQKRNG